MLSDIENLDIMLGENHFSARERDGSLNSNLPRRSRSSVSNESENGERDIGRNPRNINSRENAECDRNSIAGNSSAEINRLSSELNSRISREMDEMMNSVNVQIQRAISEAISTQVLPQIQNVIMASSGHGTRKGWDVSAERPESTSEVQRNLNAKSNSRNEQDRDQFNSDYPHLNVHDTLVFIRHYSTILKLFFGNFPFLALTRLSFFTENAADPPEGEIEATDAPETLPDQPPVETDQVAETE